MFTQDSLKNEVIYSNEIKFYIKKTDKPQPYLQIERLAEGKSFAEANQRAEKINYNFKVVGNTLILDNYLLTEMASKYRNQNVELYLYLPVGTIFKADESVERYDYSDDDFFSSTYSSENFVYKVENNQIKCLNCLSSDTDNVDSKEINITNENDSTEIVTVKINGKVVTETKSGKKGSLKMNKEGILIKTE